MAEVITPKPETKEIAKPAVKKDYCNVPHSVLSNKIDDIKDAIAAWGTHKKFQESHVDKKIRDIETKIDMLMAEIKELRKPWYKR